MDKLKYLSASDVDAFHSHFVGCLLTLLNDREIHIVA